MIHNDPTNVMAAFEILVEEIEAEIQFIQRVGSRALESGDYKKAREALDRVQEVTAFREKAAALRNEWERMVATENEEEVPESREDRRNPGRLRRGLRTPEKAYFRPILESLRDLGGSAPMGQVLDLVLTRMRPTLREVDFEPLASDPEMPRWRNAAQWARNTMVQEGLLRDDSPRGVWQIAEAGVRFLEEPAED